VSLLDRLQAGLAGRYRLEREIGRGGMAIVFLARDLKHDRDVAIKVLTPELSGAMLAERFLREIRIGGNLQHPHIIPVYDSGDADGLLYYAMPYVEGESLRQRLDRERQLPFSEVVQITREVAGALTYAHGRGVVHRDIKPENIMLSGGHALVADFGIARALNAADDGHLTATGLILGTPFYMSPEQGTSGVLDSRSDIYSLGCVVYEMLCGEPPFTGPTTQAVIARHASTTPPSLRVVRPTISHAVEAAVETALAKIPADRYRSADEFAEALAQAAHTKRRPWPRVRLRRAALAAGAALAVAVAAWAGWRQLRGSPRTDPNLVAVAPFDVLDPQLADWREGAMELLSRNLDGAGPLRVVSPTVVVRGWQGRADVASMERLGRRTGAGMGVFGAVGRSGRDSVRLTASILDLRSSRVLGEATVTGGIGQIDRAVDSLTLDLLRVFSRARPIGAVQFAAMPSTSLPALKAYLQGEQHFRRTAWDSAQAHYERAVELDTSFALAFRRMYQVRFLTGTGSDSLIREYAYRAGGLNRGLAERESLLVVADSLMATAMDLDPSDPGERAIRGRLYAMLDIATRRFPTDPEVWYQLGFARARIGWRAGLPPTQSLEAFDRAIALDSAFAPAYLEAIQLATPVKGIEATRRYIAAYLASGPTGIEADAARLTLDLLDPERARSPHVVRTLDTASAIMLFAALQPLDWWADSAETAIRIARRIADRSHDPRFADDPYGARYILAILLAWRGHVREAHQTYQEQGEPGLFYGELALFGGVPSDTVADVYSALLRGQLGLESGAGSAIAWWSQRRDTASLGAVVRKAEAILRARPGSEA
jgi:eukaryotic-like serine/threonine-protein kinase